MERPTTADIGPNDIIHALQDVKENETDQDRAEYSAIVQLVNDKFKVAEDARLTHENRWMTSYRNYRGIYGPETQFTDTEKSQVFVKITKTKVIAAYGQLADVLFAGNKFPLGIEHTPVPEGVVDAVHIDPKAPPSQSKPDPQAMISPYGFPGDGKELAPGATLKDLLGPLSDELEELDIKEGPGKTPSSYTWEPARHAAEKMEKKIHDQLIESSAHKQLRYAAFESALFGTGVICGPFTVEKEYPRWTEDGVYEPVKKPIPAIFSCSIWDIYPDPEAHATEDCDFIVRRHKMPRSKLRALRRRPFFRKEAIEAVIDSGPNYMRKWWEQELEESNIVNESQRWEVLEYWGYIDADLAEEVGITVPDQLAELEELQVSIWVCNGYVLRAVLNPFTPSRIPFNFIPYEISPYSMFGIGVAENMEDDQLLMNGFMRLAVDNAVISSNIIFEIDETNLTPGQDLKIYPGKVFRRQAGAPGQSLFAQKIPNITNECLMLFDKARQLADEATGIPSYSHGQTGVAGVGRTAAGISMLMGASNLNIKTVVKNIDDYLLMPLGKALFAWNMQFDHDKEIKGDLSVVARGVESLLKNEVRQQRMLTFLQVGANQALAPYVKFPYLLREIAKMMDLDPDKVVNSPEEAARQAEIMKAMGGGKGDMPEAGGSAPGAPPGANPMETGGNGGGNIGVGSAPVPGEQGFSAASNPQAGAQPVGPM